MTHDFERGREAEIILHRFTEADILAGKFSSPKSLQGIVVMKAMGSKHNQTKYGHAKRPTVSVAVPKAFASHTYLVGFEVANQTATSGIVNVEAPKAALLNANLPPPGETRRVVRTIRAMAPVEAKSLRLGRWQVKGDCTTGNATLEEVTPVYETKGGLTLGEGEVLFGHAYHYVPRWGGKYGSESRPFVDAKLCGVWF